MQEFSPVIRTNDQQKNNNEQIECVLNARQTRAYNYNWNKKNLKIEFRNLPLS